MTLIWLSIASAVGWFISSLAGGGSSLILIPMISLFLGTAALAPVIAETAKAACETAPHELTTGVFAADLASMAHETDEVRLFRT